MTEYIECECGMIVKGRSRVHALSCLKYHKKSTKHKEQLKSRKIIKTKTLEKIDNMFKKKDGRK